MVHACAHVALLTEHPGCRLQFIGLDPGVCNIYVAYSTEGKIFKYSLGEYRSRSKLDSAEQLRASLMRQAGLADLPEVRRPFASVLEVYAGSVLAQLGDLLRVHGDPRLLHARLSTFNGRRAALQEAANRLVNPVPGDVDDKLLVTVVLFGDGNFSPNARGHAPSPYRVLRAVLERVPNAVVLLTPEGNTTKVRVRMGMFAVNGAMIRVADDRCCAAACSRLWVGGPAGSFVHIVDLTVMKV